jgi:hypothetical protein
VADQPFTEGKTHLPHRTLVEADGGPEHQVLEIGLGQVDRADVGVQALGDEIDDVVQGLVQVVGTRDDSRDVRKQRVSVGNGTPLVGRPPKSRPIMVPEVGRGRGPQGVSRAKHTTHPSGEPETLPWPC